MKNFYGAFKTLTAASFTLFSLHAKAQQAFDIDSSFGQNGRLELNTAKGNTMLYDVKKQTDGKVLSAGQIKNATNDLFFFRTNADGTPDNSFGNNGKLSWDLSANEGVNAIALQTDGKIVACGWKTNNNTRSSILTRIDANGVADNSFGNQGIVAISAINGSSGSVYRNVKIQPDGKIVVAGIAYYSSGNKGIVQRYKTNGTLDSTFGTNGTVSLQFVSGSHNYAEDIYIQTDGKIVVLGYSTYSTYKTHLTRLDVNGTMDASFGTSGIFTPTFSGFTSLVPSWLTVLSDGRIEAIGYGYNGSQIKIICYRVSAAGQLETGFGVNGLAQFAASTNNNYTWDAYLYPNDDLAMAVEYYNSSAVGAAAILKIDSAGNAINTYGTNGFSTFATSSTAFASAIANDNDSLFLTGAMMNSNGFNYEGFVLKADATGTANNSFGLAATASGTSNTFGTKMFRLPSGNIILLGTNENGDNDIVMTKMDKDGNLIATFGDNGTLNINSSSYDLVSDAVYMSNNHIALISQTGKVSLSFSSLGTFSDNQYYTITILDTNGQVTAGPHDATFDATEFPKGLSMEVDGNGNYVVLGRSSEPVVFTFYLARHLANFSADNTYGTSGKINLVTSSTTSSLSTSFLSNLTIAPDNKVVYIENTKYPRVIKRNDDASGDASFGIGGSFALGDTIGGDVTAPRLMKGVSGYYLSYNKAGIMKIMSIDFAGQTNTSFSTAAVGQGDEMLAYEMADTSLLVAVRKDSSFTIKHILPNGNLDTNFNNNTGAITVIPFAKDQLFTDWAVTSDTSIYLYHQFRVNGNLTTVGISKISGKQAVIPTPPPTTSFISVAQQNASITVYPNPIQNQFQVAFSDKKINAADYSYQLFDMTGRIIPVNVIHKASGTVQIECYDSLPSGNYILSVSDMKGFDFTMKLSKY